MMTKAQWRTRMTRRLQRTDPEELSQRGLRICDRALGLQGYREARRLGLYAAVGREVRTDTILVRAQRDEKTVFLPSWDPAARRYVWRQLAPNAAMRPGPMGIPEPVNGAIADAASFDLVFVPGLGFDRRGNRLGHGAGHFDRLLGSLSPSGTCLRVGLAYDFQCVDAIPAEPHDVAMDFLVTETCDYDTTRCETAPSMVRAPAAGRLNTGGIT